MFRIASNRGRTPPTIAPLSAPYLSIVLPDRGQALPEALQAVLPEGRRLEIAPLTIDADAPPLRGEFVLSLFVDPQRLDRWADRVLAARAAGGRATLLVAVEPTQLVSLGRWLNRRADADRLAGVRLLLIDNAGELGAQVAGRLQPAAENNVIRMPITPEVENSPYRNFFVFSPELQRLVERMRGFAENGVTRAYLLGGPGSGKTSLAYYYWLVRKRGRFVTVNLSAENTGDKAAVKSLLCGHVSGAFPGAGARTGAFAHARDGVCFLDESHGVLGPVIEVLMEALDNGQYLPFGASAKQMLECAILFASNRSWEHLQNAVNLDEFTRMGAAVLEVPELTRREEDMIAVTASTLARLADRCTTWRAPAGLSRDAWALVRNCRWHGNVRALVRVLEAAFVDTAAAGGGDDLISAERIAHGISLWEPKTHHSHQIYAVA